MKILNFEPKKNSIRIRPDQPKQLEIIKFKGKMEIDLTIPKNESIRAAIDRLFEISHEEILELLSEKTKMNNF